MIYTCSFNPSLDYYMEFDKDIVINKTNRSQIEYFEAGGKGVNVSIVLSNLGISSKALGFVGGFTKNFYINLLERYTYLQPNFVYTEGHTRINVKVVRDGITELNGVGPQIDHKSKEALLKRIERIDENDIFVLSGNIQNELKEFAHSIISSLQETGVRFVIDTDASMLKELIKYQPLLIKPNIDELSELCGYAITDKQQAISEAQKLYALGVKNVIVSLGEKGSILVCSEGIFEADILDEVVIGTTGSGDSMIAGFIFNIQRGFKSSDAYRYACCCGLATTYSQGLATREKIDDIFERFDIKKIG